jgi:peptidoglycan/LPS O-acetylase OafA/YrhL
LLTLALGPWLPGGATAILIGCAAGVAFVHRLVATVPTGASIAALIAAVPLAMVATETHSPLRNTPAVTLFASASVIVILAAACDSGWWFGSLVSREPLRYLGRISYGLYVWHLVLFKVFFGWPVGLPVTLAVAVLSYRYIEQPFLRRGRSRRRPIVAASPQLAA